jgi:hypothetical protein
MLLIRPAGVTTVEELAGDPGGYPVGGIAGEG